MPDKALMSFGEALFYMDMICHSQQGEGWGPGRTMKAFEIAIKYPHGDHTLYMYIVHGHDSKEMGMVHIVHDQIS